jgi:hypothetical protein
LFSNLQYICYGWFFVFITYSFVLSTYPLLLGSYSFVLGSNTLVFGSHPFVLNSYVTPLYVTAFSYTYNDPVHSSPVAFLYK